LPVLAHSSSSSSGFSKIPATFSYLQMRMTQRRYLLVFLDD
jgi:hypothetical protein